MGTQRVKLYQEPEEAKKEKEKKEAKKEEEQPLEPEKGPDISPEGRVKEKPSVSSRRAKTRGKKWQGVSQQIDQSKTISVSEALDFIKKTAQTKFDSSVEVHIRLLPKKGQTVRGTLVLPHGSGKEPKVAIFSSDLLSQIEKGKINFDILLAKPEDMPALAKVAKILGPKGLMPNPKSGTISDKPEEAIKRIKSGQIEFKTDPQNNLHQMIGKVSWETKKLAENFNVLISAIKQYNPTSVTICSTMGPGIRVKITES